MDTPGGCRSKNKNPRLFCGEQKREPRTMRWGKTRTPDKDVRKTEISCIGLSMTHFLRDFIHLHSKSDSCRYQNEAFVRDSSSQHLTDEDVKAKLSSDTFPSRSESGRFEKRSFPARLPSNFEAQVAQNDA